MAQVLVTMKTLAAGPNGIMQPGKTYRVEKAEADQLIAGRYAVLGGSEIVAPKAAKPPKPAKEDEKTGGEKPAKEDEKTGGEKPAKEDEKTGGDEK